MFDLLVKFIQKPPKAWIVKAWVLPEEDAPELYVKWANDWCT